MLVHYRAQQWDQAQAILEALLAAMEPIGRESSLFSVYAERISRLRLAALPADWDAVYTFDKK